MKTATLIGILPSYRPGISQKLYKLDPPLNQKRWNSNDSIESYEFVIVSAASIPGSDPETFIFPANEGGDIVDWLQMDGSFKGGFDHERALRNAGYEVGI